MIRVENLYKSFGEKEVLKNVCLKLAPGKITCLMGASGIGKTTLANILAGLVKPDNGKISSPSDMRVSMVFQEDRLLEWETALTNILFVASRRQATNTAIDLLTQAGLSDSANKKAAKLSGGMKRRVSICRALIAQHNFLILDEPFKGLDAETKHKIMDMVKANAVDKYTLCITHDPAEVEYLGGYTISILNP